MDQIVILTDEQGTDPLFLLLVQELFPECDIRVVHPSDDIAANRNPAIPEIEIETPRD